MPFLPFVLSAVFTVMSRIQENEVEDTTAAVRMVDKYGAKDTPGNIRVITTIFINHKYSCSGVFNFILPSRAPYEDIQEEDCLMSPAGTKCTSQSSYVVAVSSSMCHALLDVPACSVGYHQPFIDEAPGAN